VALDLGKTKFSRKFKSKSLEGRVHEHLLERNSKASQGKIENFKRDHKVIIVYFLFSNLEQLSLHSSDKIWCVIKGKIYLLLLNNL
jgi:hypothetical protein